MDTTPAEIMAMNRHQFELSSIHQSEHEFTTGSVLAIVQFPDNPGADCNGCAFKPVYQVRVDYDKLMATGSAKIQAMLAPRRQERIRRRHNLQQLPAGVEYVIDLTPPSEGAERADLVASLWLPKATKLWFLAGQYTADEIIATGHRPFANKPVGAVLVLGHDDRCCCVQYQNEYCDGSRQQKKIPGIFAGPHVPRFRQIDDYCEVRHRVNIVRLLRAINGADLLINSATRMWTLVHIAISLEVTSVIRDSVAQWFLATPNTKFMEIFPEESFKVALALRIPDVLVTSFKVLVNDFAIDHAASVRPHRRPPLTWANRERGDYGDMPMDPVEHAGIAFYERIKRKFDAITSDTALDDLGIPEWKRLRLFCPLITDAQAVGGLATARNLGLVYQKLVNHIQVCFQDHVSLALRRSPESGPLADLIEAQRLHYTPKDQLADMAYLQGKLNNYQRALCPFFWQNLRVECHEFWNKIYGVSSLKSLTQDFNRLISMATTTDLLDTHITALNEHSDSRAPPRFNSQAFIDQVSTKLGQLVTDVLGTDWENDAQGPPMVVSDHIIRKLEESELKFLPIWAGGCDDGSGGVFQDAVPPAEMGPSEPGPAYHTGWTVAAYTDAAGTDAATVTHTASISDLGLDGLAVDDVPRSLDAQGGSASTATPARLAHGSEQFVVSDNEFADAMCHEPAEHQVFGQALMMYVDGDVGDDGDSRTVSSTVDYEVEDEMFSDDTLSAGSAEGDLSDFEML